MSAKQSNTGRFLILVMLVSLLSAAAGAAGIWYINNNANGLPLFKNSANHENVPAVTHVAPPVTAVSPIFLELEPFTFTLRTQNSSRILYLGLTLQLKDLASKERIEQFMPIVRSRVITDLGDIPPESLNARETKDAIRTVVARALEAPFGNEIHRQAIADVLINAYVVQ